MKRLLIKLIQFYQIFLSFDRGIFSVLAPGGACKFEISCSEYLKLSIDKQGITKGIFLGGKRILSCR